MINFLIEDLVGLQFLFYQKLQKEKYINYFKIKEGDNFINLQKSKIFDF